MNQARLDVNGVDYAILITYFAVVLGVGFAAKRYIKTSLDYFLSGRSLPAWITGLAFISANLGATEVLGMAANGAQYGVATVNYYWIGAIPAMVFLGLVMMPFYYGSKVRSVPEYLLQRFNPASHKFNSWTFARRHDPDRRREPLRARAGAEVPARLADHPRHRRRGGDRRRLHHRSAACPRRIYNEVLQFFVILAALIPIAFVGLHDVGGWSGLQDKIKDSKIGEAGLHALQGTGTGHVTNPIGVSWIGIVFGLGFVLAFGYWTTNFAEVQRALCAKDLSAAERTPLIGAIPKLFLPFIMILPGMIALVVIPKLGTTDNLQFNNSIPLLMNKYLPNGMLGIALTGLMASFMAGVAANVSAFNTVVTTDLVEPYFKPGQSGRVVRALRPHRDGRRHRHQHLHGADRVHLRQPHELPAGAVLHLQRAAVRDVHHRHVLEADDAGGGVLGADRRARSRRR